MMIRKAKIRKLLVSGDCKVCSIFLILTNRRITAIESEIVTAIKELPQCISAKKNNKQKVDTLKRNAALDIRLAKDALQLFVFLLFSFIMRYAIEAGRSRPWA